VANRRMVAKSISISEQVNNMSDFAKLLFTWMIPHADDWGMIKGSAKVIKALVVPLTDHSTADVEKALQEIADSELIFWFENEGDQYIEFCKWDGYQSGLHKRTKPNYVSFREIPGSSGKFPLNLTELNLTKPNPTEGKVPEKSDAYADIENEFGRTLSPMESEHIGQWGQKHNQEVIMAAVKIAAVKNIHNIAYIDKILLGWEQNNLKTIQAVEDYEKRGRGTKSKAPPTTGLDKPKSSMNKFYEI